MPRHAEPVDMEARYDIRTIGQLITDDEQELSRTAVLEHPNLLTALDDASGRVEAALRHGGRYSLEDIGNLTGNSRNHLKSIVCAVAMSRLLRRRPGSYTDLLQQVSAEAEEHLSHLTKGHDVFTLDIHVDAGLLSDMGNRNVETLSLMKLRNNLSDNVIGKLFPHRGNR